MSTEPLTALIDPTKTLLASSADGWAGLFLTWLKFATTGGGRLTLDQQNDLPYLLICRAKIKEGPI